MSKSKTKKKKNRNRKGIKKLNKVVNNLSIKIGKQEQLIGELLTKENKSEDISDLNNLEPKTKKSKVLVCFEWFTKTAFNMLLLGIVLVSLLKITPWIADLNSIIMKITGTSVFVLKDNKPVLDISKVLFISAIFTSVTIVLIELISIIVNKINLFKDEDLRKDLKKLFEYAVCILLFYLFFLDSKIEQNHLKAITSLELLILKMWLDPSKIRECIHKLVVTDLYKNTYELFLLFKKCKREHH